MLVDSTVGAEPRITVWPTVVRGSSEGHGSVTKGKYTAIYLNPIRLTDILFSSLRLQKVVVDPPFIETWSHRFEVPDAVVVHHVCS